MTFIHVADIHASKARLEETLTVLRKLYEYVSNNTVDHIFICGDFWDSVITNTKASGFTKILEAVKLLCEETKVLMIYGTPSHEPDGSLEVFKTVGCTVIDEIKHLQYSDCDVLCIPEPRRSDHIGSSQEEIDNNINRRLSFLRQYKKQLKPYVVLYHGEVKGARYQNGMYASSPIAIPKELFDYIKPDYIACGHIHDPQEVFPNCNYSGSTYPVNFGETHDAGFYVVTIDLKTTAKFVSFGFPQNITVDLTQDNLETFLTKDFSNKRVKINLSCTERINTKQLEEKVIEVTHASDCKIIPSYPNTTNVRAKEICEQKSIAEKVVTWAEVNNVHVTNGIKKKAVQLEESMLIKYTFPKHIYRLLWASIKGAIGFSCKERVIDFTQYTGGVITMVGANGSGKSTTIENLHPFPRMLTLPGKLRDYFNLKDSHRILVYQDETGKKYRFTILIDGEHQNGTTKYYVEVCKKDEWIPVRECDGNLDSYNKYLTENFGSLEMFARTSFFSDKDVQGMADIAKATKSERMNMFQKLAGNDHYITLLDFSKEKSKELDVRIKEAEFLIASKGSYTSAVENAEKAIKEINANLEVFNNTLSEYKEKLSDLKKKDIEYQKFISRSESDRLLSAEYSEKIKENLNTIKQIEDDLVIAEKLTEIGNKAKMYKELCCQLKDRERKLKEVNDKMNLIYFDENKYLNELTSYNSKISSLETNQLVFEKDIEHLNSTLMEHDFDKCPVCNSKLSAEKSKEIYAEAEITKGKILELTKTRNEILESIKSLVEKKNVILNLQSESAERKARLTPELEEAQNNYNLVESNIKRLEEEGIDKFIDKEPKFKNHKLLITEYKNLNADLEEKIKALEVETECEDVSDKLKIVSDKVSELESKISEINGVLQYKTAEIETNTTVLKEIAKQEHSIRLLKSEKSDYDVLCTAFSNSGIPALELESLIPNVVSVANDILHKSYGDNLTIIFSPTRQGSSKIIEDFRLTVFNASKNCEEPLVCLSSGELVWIKQAISYASTVTLHNNSGYGFETRFMDESDGHLDVDKKLQYMKMVNETHLEGNAYQTILITHSQEIKEISEQIIEIK